ncbi:MAG: lasso peptide biosynthesis B2 protein [Planctomycetota bacterium]
MKISLLRAHVWASAFFVPLWVRLLPLTLVIRLYTPPAWLRPYCGLNAEQIHEVVRSRLRRPHLMRRRACLREGLLLHHFLLLAGRAPKLHFAVLASGQEEGRLHGHCWITVEGTPVSDPPDEPHAEVLACCSGRPVQAPQTSPAD